MPSSSYTGTPRSISVQDYTPENNRSQSRRARNLRDNVQSIFVGRGHDASIAAGRGSNNRGVNDAQNRRTLEQKTPKFTINMPSLPSTRLFIPNLRRSTSVANRDSLSTPQSNVPHEALLSIPNSHGPDDASSTISSALPSTDPGRTPSSDSSQYAGLARIPEPSMTRDSWRDRLGRRNRRDGEDEVQPQTIGVGPEEQELADLATRGRQRRERRKRRPVQPAASTSTSESPSQYRSRRKREAVKSKIIRCAASGLFLALLLCVYLALALSDKIASQEFHVIIILIVLVTTVFFCHSLIRLCIILLRPASDFDIESRSSAEARMNRNFTRGTGGYANPQHPIRVQILRDEEAAGIESEATKIPPPAYGLWRESVRVDPNRIYWARNTGDDAPEVPPVPSQHRRENESVEGDGNNALERTATANRPPSYVSEDGVDYVIEARGRSIAPPELTEMRAEHADQVLRNVDGRVRGISLSHARSITRGER